MSAQLCALPGTPGAPRARPPRAPGPSLLGAREPGSRESKPVAWLCSVEKGDAHVPTTLGLGLRGSGHHSPRKGDRNNQISSLGGPGFLLDGEDACRSRGPSSMPLNCPLKHG